MDKISDLEVLILRCRTDQAQEYIAEAVSCYRAGAYRATIVNTWIAIVYDLIDKIRELALSGDGIAKGLIREFDNHQRQIDEGNNQAIKTALEFERNILTIAKDKMQFFDQQQLIDLTRLREDRNRCAHPSYHRVGNPYRPSAEQARMHLRNAIVHVLSQKPIQGKAAIEKITTIVSSAYFPVDVNKAVVQLKDTELSNPRDSLLKGVIDSLMFGYFTEGSALRFTQKTITAIKAIIEIHREHAEKRVGKQINTIIREVVDKDMAFAVYMALDIPEARSSLTQSSLEKVIQFIEIGPTESVLSVLQFIRVIESDELLKSMNNRLSMLEVDDLNEGIIKYGLGEHAISRAIQLYEQVKSWKQANSVTTKVIFPLFEYFSKEDLNRLLAANKEADLVGSHGFSQFINLIKQKYSDANDMIENNNLHLYI